MLAIKHRHDDHSRLSSPIINCMNTFSGNLLVDEWLNLSFKKEDLLCCFLIGVNITAFGLEAHYNNHDVSSF